MALKWKPIATAPLDVSILVYGGRIGYELRDYDPMTEPVKVRQDKPGYFSCPDVCGYAVWVENPTGWQDLPSVPAAPEYDL